MGAFDVFDNIPYAAAPVGYGINPLRSREKVTDQRFVKNLHAQAWKRLIEGTLQTRKAAYTAAARFTSFNSTTQTIPHYSALGAGSGDNTTITADQAFFTAVTAVYNVTDDPTKTTNLYSSFLRDIQQVALGSAPAAGKTLEVQGTVLPYQGMWIANTPTQPTLVIFQVLDFDGYVAVTTDGTGGTTKSPMMNHSPLTLKLPLPPYQSAIDSAYLNDAIRPADNFATAGTEPRTSAQAMSTWEMLEVTGHSTNSTTLGRFCGGFQFVIATGASTRGAASTNKQTQMFLPPFNPTPTRALSVIHALVRVVDHSYADAAAYPIGRTFLFVGTRVIDSVVNYAATLSGGTCACDIFQPASLPVDSFDGLVTL